MQEGKEVNRYRVQANLARFVTELPDGLLLTADSSRLVQIWDVGKGTEVRRFETEPGWLCSGRAVPGGKQVLLAGWNAGLWDIATGKKLVAYEGHQGDLAQMTISPDGKQLVTASFDGSVRLWDFASGALLQVLTKQEEFVYTAAFSPDSQWLATAGGGRKEGKDFLPGSDHAIRIWHFPSLVRAPAVLAPADDMTSAKSGETMPREALRTGGRALWVASGVLLLMVVLTALFFARRKQSLANVEALPPLTFPCPSCGKNLRTQRRTCQ